MFVVVRLSSGAFIARFQCYRSNTSGLIGLHRASAARRHRHAPRPPVPRQARLPLLICPSRCATGPRDVTGAHVPTAERAILNFRPLTSRLIARARRTSLYADLRDGVECDPASTMRAPPPIASPDELDRIVGHHPQVDAAHNLARLQKQVRVEPATMAYPLHDVTIADGSLLTPGNVQVLRQGRRRAVLAGRARAIEEGLLATEWTTERYFGHWVVDGWHKEELARERGVRALALDRPPYAHEPGYRALIGSHPDSCSYARVRSLWVVDDRGMNAGRTARLDRVRTRLRDAVPGDGPALVFMKRGRTAVGRSLANEDEVAAALADKDFQQLAPEERDAATIARTLRSARIVVSVEGSAIAHAVAAMPAGGCVLTIQSPHEFNSIWRPIAEALGIRFAFTVGTAADREGSFAQPIDRLLSAVELVERTIA